MGLSVCVFGRLISNRLKHYRWISVWHDDPKEPRTSITQHVTCWCLCETETEKEKDFEIMLFRCWCW